LFFQTTGSFLTQQYFDLALQPSLMLKALHGKTKYDFLGGRKPSDVVATALAGMPEVKAYRAGGIAVPGEDPIPYSNRGTYIQLLEWLGSHWSMRTILPPGEAESGPHQVDQAPLSRLFNFKPAVTP
jgi:penicillin amidase